VNDAKHGRIGPDPQSEHEYDESRKGGIFPNHPKCVSDILEEVFEPPSTAGIAALLADLDGSSKRLVGHSSRILKGHAGPSIFVCLTFDMEAEFVFQFAFQRRTTQKGAEPI
jgi:hypothetical protein